MRYLMNMPLPIQKKIIKDCKIKSLHNQVFLENAIPKRLTRGIACRLWFGKRLPTYQSQSVGAQLSQEPSGGGSGIASCPVYEVDKGYFTISKPIYCGWMELALELVIISFNGSSDLSRNNLRMCLWVREELQNSHWLLRLSGLWPL